MPGSTETESVPEVEHCSKEVSIVDQVTQLSLCVSGSIYRTMYNTDISILGIPIALQASGKSSLISITHIFGDLMHASVHLSKPHPYLLNAWITAMGFVPSTLLTVIARKVRSRLLDTCLHVHFADRSLTLQAFSSVMK